MQNISLPPWKNARQNKKRSTVRKGNKMKKYILHWLDGTNETVEGDSIEDAFRRAGYGAGAIPALDYYELVSFSERCIAAF